MGVYDSVFVKTKDGKEVELQFKNDSKRSLRIFAIGDMVPWPEGILVCHDGVAVVFGGRLVAAFAKGDDPFIDKWNSRIAFPMEGWPILLHPDVKIQELFMWMEQEKLTSQPWASLVVRYYRHLNELLDDNKQDQ